MVNKEITLEDLISAGDVDCSLDALSFEKGLKLLEDLVGKVEGGALPLDKAVCSYEKGIQLIDHLRKQLVGAEEKLKVLQRPAASKKEN